MAVPTVNVTCTVTNQTGAVVAGATVTAQLTGIDVYGTNYIFPSIQSFVTDINGLVTMPLFPNALGARRTAYQFIATDPITGRALINITAVVPNQNIDLSVLDAINKLPAYAPPLTQPFSAVLTSMASSAALFSMSQLVPAADQMMYFSGPNTALLASLTAFGRSLVAAANAGLAATVLGLGTGNLPTFSGVFASGYVSGGNNPLNPGNLGANRWVIDSLAGQTRFFVYGPDAVTNGSFKINSQRSDGTNTLDILNISGTGALTAPVNVSAPYLQATGIVSAVGTMSFESNFLVLQGGTAGFQIRDSGDANTNLQITDAGAATFRAGITAQSIDSGSGASIFFQTGPGNKSFEILQAAASAVNWWGASGQATGITPFLGVRGETNVTGVLQGLKGTGTFRINEAVNNTTQFEVLSVPTAARWPTVAASIAGNSAIGTSAGGLDLTSATVRFTGIGTTAVAANATLNAVGSNDLLRSTSSKRYKTEIEALSRDEALTLLRKLNPITYASLSEHDDPYLRHSGFIAEEVFDINPLFVSLSNKRPESVQYERLTVPLVAGWQDHDTRLAALEARIH